MRKACSSIDAFLAVRSVEEVTECSKQEGCGYRRNQVGSLEWTLSLATGELREACGNISDRERLAVLYFRS
jgi:hypothetical protein